MTLVDCVNGAGGVGRVAEIVGVTTSEVRIWLLQGWMPVPAAERLAAHAGCCVMDLVAPGLSSAVRAGI